MKKKTILPFLAYFTIFSACTAMSTKAPGIHGTADESTDIRHLDMAGVVIQRICSYTFEPVEKGRKLEAKIIYDHGNGFFVEISRQGNYLGTAGHVVSCPEPSGEKFFRGLSFGEADVKAYQVEPKFVVIYRGLLLSAEVAKKIFNERSDVALLSVDLPEGVSVYKIPVLTGTSHLDYGTPLVVFGRLLWFRSWIPRLYKTYLEFVERESLFFIFHGATYPGLSGSVVCMYKDGKYRAVGVASMANTKSGSFLNFSWASAFPERFFDF